MFVDVKRESWRLPSEVHVRTSQPEPSPLEGSAVSGPVMHLPDGREIPLRPEVSPVGRAPQMVVRLADPTVSALHAELVRRGPYLYVQDLGLSHNGTWVNERPIGRRVLTDGDRIRFGDAEPCRITVPVPDGDCRAEQKVAITPRQRAVLEVLCRPITREAAFCEPVGVSAIASELGVSELAVRRHLGRLAVELAVPEDAKAWLARIANAAVERGLVAGRRGFESPCAARRTAGPMVPAQAGLGPSGGVS